MSCFGGFGVLTAPSQWYHIHSQFRLTFSHPDFCRFIHKTHIYIYINIYISLCFWCSIGSLPHDVLSKHLKVTSCGIVAHSHTLTLTLTLHRHHLSMFSRHSYICTRSDKFKHNLYLLYTHSETFVLIRIKPFILRNICISIIVTRTWCESIVSLCV